MKLQRLEIINFRNLKNVVFDIPQDKKVIAFTGRNGIGKSTIIDSIMWLLTDETLVYGCQNADNVDVNNKKEAVNVKAVFIKDDGVELKLQRVLTPTFTKSGEFKNYTNELFINDANYSVKDYITRIRNQELGISYDNDPEVSGFNTLRSVFDYNYLNNNYQVNLPTQESTTQRPLFLAYSF